jgi:hypothetical protein
MIDYLFTAGQWLGLLVFVFGACLIINCAAEEIRTMPRSFGALTTHDWDAPTRPRMRDEG